MVRWFYTLLCLLLVLFSTVQAAIAQETTQPLFIMEHGERIEGGYLNPDKDRLVTVGINLSFKLWDVTTGKLISEHRIGRFIDEVVWIQHGDFVITRSHGTQDCADCLNGFIHIFTADGQLQTVIEEKIGLSKFVMSAAESQLLLISLQGALSIYDLQGNIVQTLPYDKTSSNSFRWYSDKHILFENREENNQINLIVWDTERKAEILHMPLQELFKGADLETERTRLRSLVATIDQTSDNTSFVWIFDNLNNLVSGGTGDQYDFGDTYLMWLDRPQLVSQKRPSMVYIWDTTGKHITTITHKSYIHTALWNADQTQLVIGSGLDTTLSVWTPAGKHQFTLFLGGKVQGAAWSPDSTYILAWSSDNTVSTFYARNGQRYRLYPMDGLPAAAAFDEYSRDILARTGHYPDDGKVHTGTHEARLWTVDGKLLAVYAHDAELFDAQWLAGRVSIITWSADGVVKVWEVYKH